jgi:hypothetical protein
VSITLPPLSVLAAWRRRGSAILDDLTEAAAWDALAANAVSPAQAAACISRADEIVLGNVTVLHAVLDEEDRAAAQVVGMLPIGNTPALAGSWAAIR